MDLDPIAITSLTISVLGGGGLLAYLRFFRDRKKESERAIALVVEHSDPVRDLQAAVSELRREAESFRGRCRREDVVALDGRLHAFELRLVQLESNQRHVAEGVDAKLTEALVGIRRLSRSRDGRDD